MSAAEGPLVVGVDTSTQSTKALVVDVATGRVVASGAPDDVITSELIREVFDLDALVVPDPVSGSPIVLPRGRHHVTAAQPVPVQTGASVGHHR